MLRLSPLAEASRMKPGKEGAQREGNRQQTAAVQ